MLIKFRNPIYLALIFSLYLFGSTSEIVAEEIKFNQVSNSLEIAQHNKDDEKEEEEKEIKLKGIPKDINKIAEKITVRIDSPNGNGSGIIFAQDNDKYYVVTAKHVVEKEQDYQIITEDDKVHDIELAQIKKLRDTDLAILTFTSDKKYSIAAFSDYTLGLNKESWVFVYGWAKTDQEPQPLLTVGKVVGKETGLFLVKDDLSLTQTNGYELIYTNLSQSGMSGGAVLDTRGRVIGIHTSAEGERYRLTNKLQLGFSLGIPIATFLESQKLQQLKRLHNLRIQTIQERADVVPFYKPSLIRKDLDSIATNFLKSPPANSSETEWVNYGNQLWRSSRYSEAVKAFNQAINKKTNFHQAYYGKGLALYDLGKYHKANKAFKQAINLDSNFHPAWYRQSLSLLNLKKYSQALKVIEKAITLKPENTALYALRGEALQNLAQYRDAIDSYDRAIAEDSNPLILTRRASIYRILGKYDLALQDLNQAIKFDPRYTEGYINRGLTYYQQGNYQQALINLNHVIARIDRQDPRAYLARGFIYQQLEEKTPAKSDFIRAFSLYSIAQLKEKTPAKSDFIRTLNRYNTAQEAELKEQEINRKIAQYSQVLTDFYHIMQFDSEEANFIFGQGITYLISDDQQQAMVSLNKAQKLFKTERDKFSISLIEGIIAEVNQPIEQSNNNLE